MRFSVVVLTYNRAALLPLALESIFSEPGDDFEILVIDDGSTDETPAVLAGYGEKIRVIHQEHAGNMAGCRTAYRESRSKWLIFVDSDDRLRPGALAALREAADAHADAALVLGRVCSVDASGRKTERRHVPLGEDALENFLAFTRGSYRAVIAGSLIDRELLALFDDKKWDVIHGVDQAVLGAGLLRKVVQIDALTLDVHEHARRLRDDIGSIHRSGLGLVEMLFGCGAMTEAARRYRPMFTATVQLERSRAYYRAGWYGESWRSFAGAARASPRALFNGRNLRRAGVSLFWDFMRRVEGPVSTPPGSWLYGHRLMLWADQTGFLTRSAQAGGPVVRLRLRPRTYLLREPADALHVLVRQAKGYHKTGILKTDPILAGGVIGMELPEQLEARRAVPAVFGKQAIGMWAPIIAEVIEKHIAKWQGPRVEVGLEAQRLSGEIGSRLLLGCADEGRIEEISTLLRDAHQYARRELRARYRRWPWVAPRWMPLRRRRRYAALREKITAWLRRHIAEHPAAEGQDVLSMMRRASPGRDGDIAGLADTVFMLYLAAKDPVANAIAWLLELLGDHPDVQRRLAAEAEAVLGNQDVRAEHLPRLTYARQVVNEVWRLYPSEWLMTRRAVAEDRLPCGLRVRRGEEVMISPHLFGHDGRFFKEPERFDPERFAGEATWPAGAYIPFGAGPRSCLGEHLGRCIMVLATALIARRSHIRPCEGGRGIWESPNLFSSQPVESRLCVEMTAREKARAAPDGAVETVKSST